MAGRDELVRFGVAMEASLLRAFDAVVKRRKSTRSEILRDLARAEVTRAEVAGGGDAVGSITIVYDHHVRGLTEQLNEAQHALGGGVRSTLHVHLDAAHCLEVIVVHGQAAALQRFAERVFALRGVKHGGIDLVSSRAAHPGDLHVHIHSHDDAHAHHDHDHDHGHDHGHDHHHGHDEGGASARRRMPRAAPAKRARRAR